MPWEEEPRSVDVERDVVGVLLVVSSGAENAMQVGLTTETAWVTVRQGLHDRDCLAVLGYVVVVQKVGWSAYSVRS